MDERASRENRMIAVIGIPVAFCVAGYIGAYLLPAYGVDVVGEFTKARVAVTKLVKDQLPKTPGLKVSQPAAAQDYKL
jgi:uncharacterized membrane protein